MAPRIDRLQCQEAEAAGEAAALKVERVEVEEEDTAKELEEEDHPGQEKAEDWMKGKLLEVASTADVDVDVDEENQ